MAIKLLVRVIAASIAFGAAFAEPLCRPGEPANKCKITGEGCDGLDVTFQPFNLTVLKWDSVLKKYQDKPAGRLEAHVAVGGKDDWQMYLHGPLLRPLKEAGNYSMPPFYVQASFTNKVYRFENVKKSATRGQNMTAVQKVVAHAVAPSTSFPIENKDGQLEGLLVAEGQPFLVNSPFDPRHTTLDYGGVDYISPNNEGANCTRIFPNALDKVSHYKTGGDVTNTVSCHPTLGICFFTVWKFYDDAPVIWNMTRKKHPDCLHYCVVDDIKKVGEGCKKAGVVMNEYNEPICSQPGVGAVHGMTVAFGENLVHEDPNEFDIFLVFTGGIKFVGGESSMKKLTCKKTADGDLSVVKSAMFGQDLFETSVGRSSPFGMAPADAGGDHAWVDESGKHVWVSTFRMPNAGIHMLDYVTGDLIYSVKGTPDFLNNNYAYSAGIHGGGYLGHPKSTLLLGTSACTHPEKACAPVPWDPMTKALGLEARGLMYVIDISEMLPPAEDLESAAAKILV